MMMKSVISSLLFSTSAQAFYSFRRPHFELIDKYMTLNGAGFDWENHEVHTDDGYILQIQRLLPLQEESSSTFQNASQGEPVLILHGLTSTGWRYMRLNDDSELESPLPIALAKAGYDVWLGNSRGNIFSNQHEWLDWRTDEADYWDFSYPEMALYDLPAMIEAIREEANGQKVHYIGHSLGATQMFYALQAPQTMAYMQESLTQVIAIAPVMLPKLDNLIKLTPVKYASIFKAQETIGSQYRVLGPIFDEKVDKLCPILRTISGEKSCDDAIWATLGEIKGKQAVPIKLAKHYAQNSLASRFQEFSECWGPLNCHQTDLVRLDLIKRVPMTLVFGENDLLSDFQTQSELLLELDPSNLIVQFFEGYDHNSFCGKEPDAQLQSLVLDLLAGNTPPSHLKWLEFKNSHQRQDSDAFQSVTNL